jgi:hypothetical protein
LKTKNFIKALNYVNLRKLVKPTALCFSALFIVSMLSFLVVTPVQAETLTNVAVSSASASSYDGSYTPSRAIDGTESTANYWGTNALVTAGKLPQWLQLDLGAQKSISQIITHFYDGDSRVYTYYIQTSTDGSSWTTMVPTKTGTKSITDTFTPVTARYVRITITGNTANLAAHIEEIKIYGSTTSTATPTPTPALSPLGSSPGLSALHVDGTHLKDANGNIVILRGVVYSTSQWWGDYPGQCTEQQFIYMKNMGCNSVSLSIQSYTIDRFGAGVNCYNDANFWTKLDNIIAWCQNQGLYINLRFWATAGPDIHGHAMNDLGLYMNGGSGHYTWTEWLQWANVISGRYKNYNHIIYEPLSEALNIPLAEYVDHMQNCIDTIRANNPNAIVNVQAAGPPPYAWETCTFNMPPIGRSNIVWSWDPYGFWNPNTNSISGIYDITMGPAGRGASVIANAGGCVFFAEFGGKDVAYDSWSSTWVKNFMAMCDANGVSGYTAFRWCTASSDSFNLLTDWNGNLSTYGNDLKTYYLAHK